MAGTIPARRRMAVVLAGTAGGVDAVGYITLFHLFTAHMTGNTDGAAVALGEGDWTEAMRHFLPVPLFVAGILAGGIVRRLAERRHVRATHAWPLALEATALVAFWALAAHARFGPPASHLPLAYYAIVALPAFAMGTQTTSLRRIADHSIRTTFITGMLAVFGEQLIEWWLTRRARRAAGSVERAPRERSAAARARVAGTIWIAYAVGAVTCTVLEHRVQFTALAVPLAGVVACMILDWRASSGRRLASSSHPPASERRWRWRRPRAI